MGNASGRTAWTLGDLWERVHLEPTPRSSSSWAGASDNWFAVPSGENFRLKTAPECVTFLIAATELVS